MRLLMLLEKAILALGRRQVAKGEMKNLDVDFISLLFDDHKPANGKGAVVKSTDGKSYSYIGVANKVKAEEIEGTGYVYATVYEPGVVDSQGDSASAATIRAAKENFNKKGIVGKADVNHNLSPDPDVVISESYILKAADPVHYPNTKVGSWVVEMKYEDLNNPNWLKAKGGKLTGVSLYGTAEDAGAAQNKELIDQLKEVIKSLKASGDEKGALAIQDKVNELEKSDVNIVNKEMVSAIKELTIQLKKGINPGVKEEPGGGGVRKIKVRMFGVKKEVKIPEYVDNIVSKAVVGGEPEKMLLLTANDMSGFVDETVDFIQDECLKEITVVTLPRDNKVDAGVIADLVLKNVADGVVSAQALSNSTITITPQECIGAYSTLWSEALKFISSIGADGWLTFIINKLREKVAKAIQKLLFMGDRDSLTAALAGIDGIIELADDASDITELLDTTYTTWATRFKAALGEFDEDYLMSRDEFVIYVNAKDYVDIESEAYNAVNVVQGQLKISPDGKLVTYGGIPVKRRWITQNYFIMGLPKAIICGIKDDVELAASFTKTTWMYDWYMHLYAGFTYITDFVKVFEVTSS